MFRTPTVALRKEADEPVTLFFGLLRLQTYRQEDDDRRYWITGPDGEEVLSGDMSGIGTFANQPGREVVIPADAPAGVYRIHYEIRSQHKDSVEGFRNLRGIRMPISESGVSEVIVLDEPRMGPAAVGAIHGPPGYFFYVPEHVAKFSVAEVYSRFGPMIRNPDGEVMWHHTEQGRGNAEIIVPPEHRGRLWRIVGSDFIMDPQIPPYYAVDRDRWFNPNEGE